MPTLSYRDAINQALKEEMRRDDKVVIFGEDVAQYEGSFKVTRGILDEFGWDRCWDTPISEAAIVGMATGLAMAGLRPVPELMTVNFAFVAMDQILNHLALARYMFGGQVTCPVVIRAPGGGGHQLGSQHSHSLEPHFMHTPGILTVYPAYPADAKAMLKAAIRDDNPVMFLEHEALYNYEEDSPEEIDAGELGVANVRREGADVTLIGYGGMSHIVDRAVEPLTDENIDPEVIDLRSLRPLDTDTILASVAKTHHVVIVEECPPKCGVAAEIGMTIQERAFDELDSPIERVSGADCPKPYARELEQSSIPGADDVVSAAKRALAL